MPSRTRARVMPRLMTAGRRDGCQSELAPGEPCLVLVKACLLWAQLFLLLLVIL